ncbi:hypothetical protein SASPL_115152 [Salvia splendens]|uniref:GH3 C-terminal domain-containing protein n=1 Tax=Salvia splendens TaxID=180675 RepID=A0A8X8Y617_SALSN|nr:hypothetical protein SASPL_115152 [Salvia splendens]
MAQYIPLLDFYSEGLPQACTMYASSECYFGLNMKPMAKPSEICYTIMPNMGYFEFLPHPPFSLGQWSLLTWRSPQLPQFKFVRRKNVLLSIDADKTDELELQKAVENAAALREEYKSSVVEFTSYADTGSIPGHYVVYWELSVPGTFEELMDYAISRGASINQYKAPRCVSYTPIVELLNVRVVSAYFSPAPPLDPGEAGLIRYGVFGIRYESIISWGKGSRSKIVDFKDSPVTKATNIGSFLSNSGKA